MHYCISHALDPQFDIYIIELVRCMSLKFFLLYPILVNIYNIVKEVIKQEEALIGSLWKAKLQESSLISLSKPIKTIKSIVRDEYSVISRLQ